MEFKINHTNSLAAARYFGAFGIQEFGFNLDVLNPNHISIHEAKQIINWLYQPNIILEVGVFQTLEEIDFLKEEIGFSSVEISIYHPEFERIIRQYNHSWIKMNMEETEAFNFDDEQYKNSVFIVEINKGGDAQKIKLLAQERLFFLDIKVGLNIDEMTQNLDSFNLCIDCQKEKLIGKFEIEPYERYIPYLEGIE